MAMIPWCRVCLCDDSTKLCSVNKSLINVYEKLTDSQYNKCGYPVSMCYICVSVLRRCHRFMVTARDTNNMLEEWYNQQNETKVIQARPLHCLKITSAPNIDTTLSDTTIEVSLDVVKKEYETDDEEREVCIEFDKVNSEVTNNIKCEVEIINNTHTTEHDNDHRDNEVNPTVFYKNWLGGTSTHSGGNEYDKDEYELPMESSMRVTDDIVNTDGKFSDVPGVVVKIENDAFEHEASTSRYEHFETDENEFTQTSTNSSKKQFPCNMCTKSYKYKKDLKLHHETAHTLDNELFTCKVCHKNYKLRKSLLEHYDSTHGTNRPFACNLCPYKTAVKYKLKEHLIKHSIEKSYACKECDFKTARKRNLMHHSKKHTNERNFHCHLCDKKYILNCELKKHIKAIHSEEKPFKCQVCPYSSYNKDHLMKHVSCVHLKEKPFQCDLCERTFSTKSGIRHHLKSHYKRQTRTISEERPYACPVCQSAYKTKRNVSIHMRKHTGEKPYACSLCEYKASQKSSLNKHLKVHKRNEAKAQQAIAPVTVTVEIL